MRFNDKLRSVLTYIGSIGAILMSVAYIVCIFVMINGFKYEQQTQTIVFAVVNAAVGLLIANFLKYQGIALAKEIPDNQVVLKNYIGNKTKDKKTHNLTYFWTTTIIKDILIKGGTVGFTTWGIIKIVVMGSNDWNLLLLATVNLIMFICFGLLALNKAYDYYNEVYVPYMIEKINERGNIDGK